MRIVQSSAEGHSSLKCRPVAWAAAFGPGGPRETWLGDIQGETMTTFTLNGRTQRVEGDPQMPLLWHLRDELGMTGTKFGCGQGLCGACTVMVDGQATRSCVLPVGQLEGRRVTTIEGLSADGNHPVQVAWRDLNVSQCGYCQSGQIMQAASLLAANPRPTDKDIDAAMAGNICRCGTYPRVRAAIKRAAQGGQA